MITLHQFQVSPFCDKVRRILHWKGLEYRIREVPLVRAQAIRRINPTGKLPCLEHDGTFVADSTDIAYYLEERFPEPPILPEDPAERALCHVLDDWADESLYFYEMFLRDAVSFTADHPDPEEDPVEFEITVKGVQEKVLPELTDEWVADATEFDTVDDFRNDIRERLESSRTDGTRSAVRARIGAELAKLVEEDAPESMVSADLQARIQSMTRPANR